MRVGFVGAVEYQDIPSTLMDYLTMILSALLISVLCYILYQICFQKDMDDETDQDQYRRITEDMYDGSRSMSINFHLNRRVNSRQSSTSSR